MGKVWENQELKEELENAQSTENNIESDEDVNSIRAKTSCHLHQILSNQFNTKKQKINNNKNDKLTQLCNDIETQIFIKSNRNINKNYMEHSRNLLFNLRRNKSISDDTHDWIECAVQCTNCGHTKCKYKMKKMLFESTKSEIFGGA